MERQIKVKDFADFVHSRLKFNIYNDPYQQEYVKHLLLPTKDTQAVFVDAEAGTGKTSLAVSVGYYLLDKGFIDQIVYIRSTVSIRELGFLPGDIAEKEAPYMQPGLDALSKLDPKNKKLIDTLIANDKLVIASTSFLRGVDWDGKKFIIIDEAQNLNLQELQTVLTRPHDNSKVVIIGSSLQCDEGYKARRYGDEKWLPFQLYAHHFTDYTDLPVVSLKLHTNYRGKFSLYADKIQDTVRFLEDNTGAMFDEDHNKPIFNIGPTEEELSEAWQKVGDIKKQK